jgi:hypothetical protein
MLSIEDMNRTVQRLAGEDRSSKKRAGAGMNYGSWQLIDRSGESS